MSSTTTPTTGSGFNGDVDRDYNPAPARRSTETKAAFKTSEFFIYVAAVAGVLLASMMLGSNQETSDLMSLVEPAASCSTPTAAEPSGSTCPEFTSAGPG